jgi:predicted transcriptional regulator
MSMSKVYQVNDDRIPTTIRLNPDLSKRLKHILIDQGESFQAVVEGLIREYVSSKSAT